MARVNAMLVVGARPQFIKSAPVIKEILSKHKKISLNIVHTGQHYDPQMSKIFFHELMIPAPTANLQTGSGSHAVQTAIMMRRLEGSMIRMKPDVVLVPGDTNTTLAASLTASKLCIPVAHIEAGLRSGDITMPEEINRKITDHCSTLLFAPTRTAVFNLKREGLRKLTNLTGDTMVDASRTILPFVQRAQDSVLRSFDLGLQNYVLVTLHRPSNVDDIHRLDQIQLALRKTAGKLRVVFLVHPRTQARLAELGVSKGTEKGLTLAGPQGYIETLCLLKNASCLFTDSGGMQKESFLLHVPCITFRSSTEWPETLAGKANRLLNKPEAIPRTILTVALDESIRERIRYLKNPFGDGHSSSKIVRILEKTF